MEDEKLIAILWELFENEIKSGGPVFFSFHREILLDSFFNNGFSDLDPTNVINSSVRNFIEVDNNKAFLKPSTLEKRQNGKSASIILICQQILAVEEMVREPEGFSENAYFPRLRRMISNQLEQISQNPFEFEEFEQIWRTFASEVTAVSGSSKDTITFSFGAEEGNNKSKSFPLSQALLTRNDLLHITRRLTKKSISSLSHDNLWSRIKTERQKLPRRAQKLLVLPFLRERILTQLKSFSRAVSDALLQANTSTQPELEGFEVRIFKDSIDWTTDEFRAFLIHTEKNQRIEDENKIRNHISEIIKKRGELFLPLGTLSDYWSISPQIKYVSPGESFLVIGDEKQISKALDIASKLIANITIITKTSLFGELIKVAELTLPENQNFGLSIRAGKIYERSIRTESKYKWIGGKCLDLRTNLYLKKYLPTEINFGEQNYKIENIISANGKVLPSGGFLQMISQVDQDSSFEVSFPNSNKATIGIGVQRRTNEDIFGFLLSENGKLSPTAERLNFGQIALCGFNEPNFCANKVLSVQLMGKILWSMKNKCGIKPTTHLLEKIKLCLKQADISSEIKNISYALINEHFLMSEELIQECNRFFEIP